MSLSITYINVEDVGISLNSKLKQNGSLFAKMAALTVDIKK